MVLKKKIFKYLWLHQIHAVYFEKLHAPSFISFSRSLFRLLIGHFGILCKFNAFTFDFGVSTCSKHQFTVLSGFRLSCC